MKHLIYFLFILIPISLCSCSSDDDSPEDYYKRNTEQLTKFLYKEYTVKTLINADDVTIKAVEKALVYDFNSDNLGYRHTFVPKSDGYYFGENLPNSFSWSLSGHNPSTIDLQFPKSESEKFQNIEFGDEELKFNFNGSSRTFHKELRISDSNLSNNVKYEVSNLNLYTITYGTTDYLICTPFILTVRTPQGTFSRVTRYMPIDGPEVEIENNQKFYIYASIANDEDVLYSLYYPYNESKFNADGYYNFYIGSYDPKTNKIEHIENGEEYSTTN